MSIDRGYRPSSPLQYVALKKSFIYRVLSVSREYVSTDFNNGRIC